MLDIILDELTFTLPEAREVVRSTIRLLAALIAGSLIGYQRERFGKAAGLRTHILVAMGTSMFVIVATEFDMQQDAMSRVMQGIITGIGFLGAGAILKLAQEQEIKGLTTAAGIWMTSAVSVAIGLGKLGVALIGVILALLVLAVFVKVEARVNAKHVTRRRQEPKKS